MFVECAEKTATTGLAFILVNLQCHHTIRGHSVGVRRAWTGRLLGCTDSGCRHPGFSAEELLVRVPYVCMVSIEYCVHIPDLGESPLRGRALATGAGDVPTVGHTCPPKMCVRTSFPSIGASLFSPCQVEKS
ncbi:hypothetical protein C8Q78DRAFT_475964 [Trametes maxima]|nr:hypothetical protein C8Q78DRAFT_475964 [Trametes maxima]